MTTVDTTPARPAHSSHRAIAVGATVLLAIWAGWWVISFAQFQGMASIPWWSQHLPQQAMCDRGHVWMPVLIGDDSMWFPPWQSLGLDYLVYDRAARLHAEGNDLYAPGIIVDSPVTVAWTGTPLFFILYGWCPWVDPRAGIVIWTTVLAAIASTAAWYAWKVRSSLPILQLPLPVILAAALFSYPVIFEMERGQNHLLGVLAIMLMVLVMRRRTLAGDAAAGACLGIISIMKFYPLILLLALPFLRRLRVAAIALASIVVIMLATFRRSLQIIHNTRDVALNADTSLHYFSHSLTTAWRGVGSLPGLVMALLLLAPLAAWVSLRIWQSPLRDKLAYPYLLWICGLGTFIPTSTNDYNLHYLPLAALAVWDRRDGWMVQIGMLMMLVWWQPMELFWMHHPSITAGRFFLLKLISLLPIGMCIVRRARIVPSIGGLRMPDAMFKKKNLV